MEVTTKPVALTAGSKTWKTMDGMEKTIFSAKVCMMFASFGWIYGNTLAPDEIKPKRG